MGIPFPNGHIVKKNPQDSNLNSFRAFLLSIFVYVSVFYAFNLSPTPDLLCTTKFWFVISNTLILIIAADFSSSSQSHNTITNLTTTAPLELVLYDKTMPKYPTQQQLDHHQQPPEKIINIVENKPPHISTIHHHLPQTNISNPKPCIRRSHRLPQNDASCKNYNTSKLQEKEKMVEKQGKMVLRRTLSERHNEEPMMLEENEFTKMSDEELNKRVEEFIRRCNRQIRLEAVRQG